jgi:hypothetical protein
VQNEGADVPFEGVTQIVDECLSSIDLAAWSVKDKIQSLATI